MHKSPRHRWHCNSHQRILLEYAQLQRECPPGVYLSLKPGDPAQWSGVLFVRRGPYAPAILRFQVLFPSDYPESPPTITFTSDIFHPLVTPLTTYTYSAGTSSTNTVSATDEGRLPPGGFRLKHAFPTWFGRAKESAVSSTAQIRNTSACYEDNSPNYTEVLDAPSPAVPSSNPPQAQWPVAPIAPAHHAIKDVLRYIKQTFEDEETLDGLPLEAAGNPGAWKAWRAYRMKSSSDSKSNIDWGSESASKDAQQSSVRQLGEWNWDGVWQQRAQKGISTSLSDPVLYGSGTSDDPIRFADATDELVQATKLQAFNSVFGL